MDWEGSSVKWRSIANPQTVSASPAEPGLRSALGLTALSAVTFVLTLVTQWGILVICGAEERTDALFASLVVPNTLLTIFGVSLGHVLVPLFAGENEAESRRHSWGLLLWALGGFGLLGLILALAAAGWVPVVFPGFSRPDLAIQLCRIQLLTLVMGAGSAVFSAALHARRHFIQPELAQALGQAACLAVLGFTVARYGVVGAAWAFVVRGAVQLAFLIVSLGVGVPASLPKELLRRFWDRWKPLLAGTGIYKTEPIVDSFLSSMAGPGGLALYYLGQRLYGAALEVVRKGFAEPVLPVLSIRAGQGDDAAFRALYRRRILLILAIVLPAYALVVLAAKPVLLLLIGRGGVTPDNVHTLWNILVALGGVFLGGAAGQVVAFAWYARGDTRMTTVIGVSTFLVAVALKVAAFWKFGIVGLAVASSVHYLGTGLLSFFILERRIAWRIRPV